MSKKLKAAIIGVGSISEFHINGYLKNPDIELYAFCDINEKTLKQKAQRYGISRTYLDMNKMLSELPEIDIVSVCTHNSAHAECSIAALNAGKNVLCEKPMALNADEANSMIEAAKKNNRLLMIGFVRRFGNDAKVLKEFIDAGDMGDIYYGKASYLRRVGAPSGWFGDKKRSGGGPLIDIGVHVLDLSRYLAGSPKPVSVYGATFSKLGKRDNIKLRGNYQAAGDDNDDIYNVEDLATAMIRFDNGFVLCLDASFSLNIGKDVGTVQLYGTKAGAEISPELHIYTEQNNYLTNVSFSAPTALDFNGLFENEINHFVNCCATGCKCRSTGEDGAIIAKIVDAIYLSAKTGSEVKI